ncbi:MAG: T9SS type A sorting domain-containing protein [Candidatus Eisenbacteria bacterium]|nr:T9SS type A sorting domain-containing protein [Candidatus Eisenbacteria bacterium]
MLARTFRSLSGPVALAALLVAAHGTPASAEWPGDPTVNVPVCTATNHQVEPSAISDGAGGMIVAWGDLRNGTSDVYAQRISSAGVPLWTANGVAVSVVTGDQANPVLVSDGAGGAIITWGDARSGVSDIYAQRLNANGVAQWTANGVALCTSAGDQSHPDITTDGSGGAIVAWADTRNATGPDIYVRRINSAGTPQWTVNGVLVCNAADVQSNEVVTTDNAGGALIAWIDFRNTTDYNIYVQRVASTGIVTGAANGTSVCSQPGSQTQLQGTADGAGGMILAWQDYRSGVDYDIYAQRVSSSLVASWTANGKAVCTATANQSSPALCSDGSGGGIVSWTDTRGSDANIYTQRITGSGSTVWTTDGVAISSAIGIQSSSICTADGLGGALICREDYRSGWYADIFAQRVSGAGSTVWASNGVAVLAADLPQSSAASVSDGAGGGLFVAEDYHGTASFDLYCQRVERYGQLGQPEPSISGVKDVMNDQGGFVKVSWSASYLDAEPVFGIAEYRLWRSVPTALAQQQALVRGMTDDADAAARDGSLLLLPAAAQDYAWELAASQVADALPSYSLVTTTMSDSVPGSFPRTVFMIEARSSTSLSADRWYSAPDSGYSVDNLAPAAPAPLTGQYAAGQTRLHWNRNTEADLAGYRLYRGTSAAFVPSPATFVADLPDTGYADAAGAPYVYKLRAVDSHGNESPVATLIPSGTLGVDDFVAPRAFLALASANPSRGANTTLRFGLATSGRATLALYDASGRRVRSLVGGTLEAGEHSAQWDGRDDGGHEVAAGLYFARLEAGGNARTVRIVRAK